MSRQKTIEVHYYALLREQRGISSEQVETTAKNALELYRELQQKYKLNFEPPTLKVAINNAFATWQTIIKSGDNVIFVPPVAGG